MCGVCCVERWYCSWMFGCGVSLVLGVGCEIVECEVDVILNGYVGGELVVVVV